MVARRTSLAIGCLSVVLSLGMPGRGLGGSAADARKKQAKRVTSYVLLAETIARVGIQVGGMLDQHPYDRVLCRYARELGRLHARLFSELTAPPGAESLHRKFTEAIKGFAAAAEAYCAADYPTAAKHRQKCIREFNKSLIELIKMKQRGTIP